MEKKDVKQRLFKGSLLRKLLNIMKLTTILMFLALMQVTAASFSQGNKLNLTFKDQTIKEVFYEIERQSDYSIFYKNEMLKNIEQKSGNYQGIDVFEVLEDLLLDENLTYQVKGRLIMIVSKDGEFERIIKQQTKAVNGKVTDESGLPLPGVTILVKSTIQGTISDEDGNYSLSSVPADATLVFSFVGMLSQEIVVGDQATINVTMMVDAIGIEEVVAIGYGTVKKSDLTGSVSSITDDDFNKGISTSVDQLISGRSPGVDVVQTSSEPGGGVSVRIRGNTSVNATNEPLYVIDGVPLDNSSPLSSTSGGRTLLGSNPNAKNPLNTINTSDIESVEILKDASATAIYGARGANGVILITTKSGKAGKMSINYNFYGGNQTLAKKRDVLSTSEYIDVINGMEQDRGDDPPFSASDIAAIGEGTDWQDEIFRDAIVQNHTLSFSGGKNNTTFYTSLNYFDQKGIVKNTGIKRYVGRLRLNQKWSDRFSLQVIINTSLIQDDNSIDNIQINENAGPINTAFLYDPTEPVWNEDGTINKSPNLTINNPVGLVEGVSSKSEINRTYGNLSMNYNLTDDLVAKLNFGSDRQTNVVDVYNSRLTIYGEDNKGASNIASRITSNVLSEFTLNYSKDINENQKISVLGGVTYQAFSRRYYSMGIMGFPSDITKTDAMGLGNITYAAMGSSRSKNTLLSYLGRVNYSLLGRYLFTASFRADGSSRFGENNKFGYFPSFAFGWKLEEEAFIPDFFKQLKLRASWGQTGNQGIGNYASLTTFSAGNTALLGGALVQGTNPSRVPNPGLKWETTIQTNAGIDFSIFDGRLSGSFDYFNKQTKDMLLYVPLPPSTGYGSVLKNLGKMENKGFEIFLNSVNVSSSNFSWSTTLNFSAVNNEVVDIGDAVRILRGGLQGVGNTSIVIEGEPIDSYYGAEIIGIFGSQAEVDASSQPGASPGYPIFRDVNNDGSITDEDRVMLGKPMPDFTYGLQNMISYKNFTLDFFIQGQEGAEMLNVNSIESLFPSNPRRNMYSEHGLNRWTENNKDTKWPSGTFPSAYVGPSKVSNLVVEDASYIRLKTVRLSYTIPARKINFLNSAEVYVLGQNLFTITDYSGFNPETNSLGRSSARVDYSSYPLAKVWMLGVNLEF